MKFMIAWMILQKGFFLGDYGTCSKSVSGRKEALLKKLIFFVETHHDGNRPWGRRGLLPVVPKRETDKSLTQKRLEEWAASRSITVQ